MTHPTRREEICNRVHQDITDLIIETKGMRDLFIIPLITDGKGEAVACANYLRGHGFEVTIKEEMAEFLYELSVKWI